MENNKIHVVSVTGIIRKDNKVLICKRSEKEKAFPNKWCVPGGKVELSDYSHLPKDTLDHWFDVLELVLRKEVKEETNLEIKNIGYVSNLAFIRSNGLGTLIISLFADYNSGDVVLQDDELSDFAWVRVDELEKYDLIENIKEQIEKAMRL